MQTIDGGFYGKARVAIDWEISFERLQNDCRPDSVNVYVNVIYTMPKLSDTNENTKSIWDLWYPKLLEHELGHKDIGMKYASRIEQEVNLFNKFKKCESLKSEISSLLQVIVGELNNKQSEYDNLTNYGETQGANLDLYN